ncbi:hypothetical protein VO63_29930 [Streptomyces showdoensis]|uniref:Uncharacterized protein n=1 Tax=Streptomyces showdoensis TaxID=68268 RepID=A0A2P2GHB7_STREW|nr:hypothetical protein VO63_29930 [Streptomyces showdoensis]
MPMTTSAVSSGYAAASALDSGVRPCRHSITPHHSAHPTCRLGIAAYWLVSAPIPRGALASAPHHPYPLNRAIVSTNPWPGSSSRGGQVGSSVKPTRPSRVESISQVLAAR